MWITKKEYQRRMTAAIEAEVERRERARFEALRYDDLDKRLRTETEQLWGHIRAIRRKLEMDELE